MADPMFNLRLIKQLDYLHTWLWLSIYWWSRIVCRIWRSSFSWRFWWKSRLKARKWAAESGCILVLKLILDSIFRIFYYYFNIFKFVCIDNILIYCSLSIFPVKNWSSITPLELNAPHAWTLFEYFVFVLW